jgi:hypothetical protein
MFHRGVAVREDGDVTLAVGRMWCYVRALGPAFFVRAVHLGDDAGPRARLLGERELALAGSVAGWGPDERLYLWFPGLAGPAICLREAHQALAACVVPEDDAATADQGDGARLALALAGDRRIPLVRLAAIPGAATAPPATQGMENAPAGFTRPRA